MIVAVSPAYADPSDPCPHLLSGFPSSRFLKQVKEFRSELIRGYHLPPNYTSAYYARRIEPYLAKPTYQEVLQPQALYRGMYLTPDELAEVLENGMKLNRVSRTAAGGGISFSSDIQEAVTYIFDSANEVPNKIGVVFAVEMNEEMKLANPVVSIDGLELKDFDYIDIGAILESSGAVPVVIKSLIFPGSAAKSPAGNDKSLS